MTWSMYDFELTITQLNDLTIFQFNVGYFYSVRIKLVYSNIRLRLLSDYLTSFNMVSVTMCVD